MIFCTNNLIETATNTVNGAQSIFPISNLYTDRTIDKCFFNDYIVVDLGTATTIDTLGVISSDNTITIEANSSDVWTSPPFSQIMNYTTGTEISLELINQTYRYWRITASGNTLVSHVYIGNRYTLPNPSYGTQYQIENNGVISSSPTFQRYRTHGQDGKIESIPCPVMDRTEWDAFTSFIDTEYSQRAFIFSKTEYNLTKHLPYYAMIQGRPNLTGEFFPGKYAFDFTLLECK